MITSDGFLMGLEALAYSLRRSGTTRPLVVITTPQVSKAVRRRIAAWPLTTVEVVDPIPNPHADTVHVEGWVNSGFTKLHLWALTAYSKLVYIDADAIVVDDGGSATWAAGDGDGDSGGTRRGGVDELFDRPGGPRCPTAAPDVFPPDKFNAGVLVVEPNRALFDELCASAAAKALPSHDGGDTGFLNSFFPDWFAGDERRRLPFGYNALRTMHWMTAKTAPGYWAAVKPLKIIHYCSSPKPWEHGPDGKPAKKGDLEMLWWDLYLKAQLDNSGMGALADMMGSALTGAGLPAASGSGGGPDDGATAAASADTVSGSSGAAADAGRNDDVGALLASMMSGGARP